MGIPWVRFSHTVPAPAKTVPILGIYPYKPYPLVVCHETHGMSFTRGCFALHDWLQDYRITNRYANHHYSIIRLTLTFSSSWSSGACAGQREKPPGLSFTCEK